MAQTAQDILNAINGVTFGSGAFGGAAISLPTKYGYNAAHGGTDVETALTNAAGGAVSVAYITKASGSPFTVTGVHYAYTAGDATHFPTFGTITLSYHPSTYNNATNTYFIHGFTEHGLLLSLNASLTSDMVNGLTKGAGGDFFEILSTTDLRAGPGSPAFPTMTLQPGSYGKLGTWPSYYKFVYYGKGTYVDRAGVYHSIKITNTTQYRYDEHYDNLGHAAYIHDVRTINAAGGANPNPPTFPLTFSKSAAVFDMASVPCFALGSRILTTRGEVAVEDLVEGDEAVLAGGGARAVIWIGSRRIKVSAHPRPEEVNPIRIRAGAFADGVPARDLLLSPGHAVRMGEVLIPAGKLVNGATIVQDEVDSVRYFHVELDAHDVLLAEGLACESYLDDGNRDTFANAAEHLALYGRLDPLDRERSCASVATAGPVLIAAQVRLHARAGELGWTKTAEPDLKLLAGGEALVPVHAAHGRSWFKVPDGRDLTLASNAGRPAHLAPGQDDPRQLGVAVSEVRVDGQPLDLDGPAFARGFHILERLSEAAWRWTDGQARLDLAAVGVEGPALVEIAVTMTAQSWTRVPPMPALRLVKGG